MVGTTIASMIRVASIRIRLSSRPTGPTGSRIDPEQADVAKASPAPRRARRKAEEADMNAGPPAWCQTQRGVRLGNPIAAGRQWVPLHSARLQPIADRGFVEDELGTGRVALELLAKRPDGDSKIIDL